MRNCADRAGSAFRRILLASAICIGACAAIAAQVSNAEMLFREAKARESALRLETETRKAGAPATPLLERARILVRAYEDIARLFPTSPYSDDALLRAGVLAADSFWEFGQPEYRINAIRLLEAVATR